MPESTVEVCARTLRESILAGKLPPGVRLPTERALAAQFGVHRSTVRSALAQLEAEHLVSARQGSGYTVHDYRRDAGPDLIAALAALAGSGEQEAIAKDLLFVRRQLARAVLERVADDEQADLAPLEQAIDGFELAIAGRADLDALARADLDCVAALVGATKSTVLQLFVNPVASLLARMPRLQRAMYRAPAGNVLAYRAVVAWLRSPNRAGLDAIMAELERRDADTIAAFKRQRTR